MAAKGNGTELGARVAALRKSRGFSQQRLADEIGISRRNLAYYETQTGRMPVDILARIAETLETSVDEIIRLDVKKSDGRCVDGKLWPKWRELGGEEKKAVARLVDTFIAARAGDTGTRG